MTLEKIRAALPTHIMLTPGVHKLKKGDEYFANGRWFPDQTGFFCKLITADMVGYTHRRPIPTHILDNQAFYVWVGQYAGVVPTWENNADVGEHIREGRLFDKWLLEQMESV